jgi:hypothetical protein
MSVVAGAQRITGKISCSKPSVNEMAGGASEGIMFQRSNCTWPTPFTIDGSKPGRTFDAAIGESSGSKARVRGYNTIVMDNGDTTFVRYEGNSEMKKDGTGSGRGTWKFLRGTGKFRGITGSGTYKNAAAADGSGSADVTGHYSLPKGKK